MRLYYLVNHVWLRFIELFHKPPLVFIVKARSASFTYRGGKMSATIFFPLSSVSIAFIAYQF